MLSKTAILALALTLSGVEAGGHKKWERKFGEGLLAKCKLGERRNDAGEEWGKIIMYQPFMEEGATDKTETFIKARFNNLDEDATYSLSIYDCAGDECSLETDTQLYSLGDFEERRRGRGGIRGKNSEVCLIDDMDHDMHAGSVIGKRVVLSDDIGYIGCCEIEECVKNEDKDEARRMLGAVDGVEMFLQP